MSLLIPGVEDFDITLRDGYAWTKFRLDPNRRLYIEGYDGPTHEQWSPTHASSHSLPDIHQIHIYTGALLAHLEAHR